MRLVVQRSVVVPERSDEPGQEMRKKRHCFDLAGVDRSAIAASLEKVHDVLLLRTGSGTQP